MTGIDPPLEMMPTLGPKATSLLQQYLPGITIASKVDPLDFIQGEDITVLPLSEEEFARFFWADGADELAVGDEGDDKYGKPDEAYPELKLGDDIAKLF